ncbi:MAG: hypothetical protein WA459_10760 [Stellaceae bacterium]
MTRSFAAVAVALAAGAALTGCTGPQPFISEGDANSVEVAYTGDIADALPLARQHCAQFERVPRLVDVGGGAALFNCVPH